ncbi:uncharacterized protein LOC110680426, partial [Aedes aegypti]|uniref:Uncharacterized protein n=1 Tax=Aedes aegypti TaxID=7159 RepID=A0A903VIN8_AEDAE
TESNNPIVSPISRKELVNQESRYSVKLEDAEKRASEAQTKVYELKQRLDEVEREVSLKECNVDRLKAELDAACKECETIRARMHSQSSETGRTKTEILRTGGMS